MAENKKSFLLYCDTINTVKKLSDEQAGLLFKHILMYVNDENPVTDNFIIEIAFEPIKQALKRDLIKYESIREKKRQAGLASAESKKQNQHVSTCVDSVEHKSTESTVNDNVIVIDNVIEKEEEKNITCFSFVDFWSVYPNKTNKSEAEKKYNKLSETDRQLIKDSIQSFINFKPFKDYNYPMPNTYINQKRWNDYISNEPKQIDFSQNENNGLIDLSKAFSK